MSVDLIPINNMTDTWLRALKGGKNPVEARDSSSPGLRVRVTPKGKKSFVYSYSHPVTGQMKRVTLGSYPSMKLAKARAKWSNLSEVRKQGIDPKDQLALEAKEQQEQIREKLDQPPPGLLVTQLIKKYMDEYSSIHKKSWREEQRVLKKEFEAIYGKYPAADITKGQIRELISSKRAEGKKAQAQAVIAHVRGMYNWAIEEELVNFNPAVGVDKRNERKKYRPQPRQRRWHENELKTILVKFPDQYSDLLRFILLTGCRFGEAVEMEWSDIYLDEWRQPGRKTKNGHDHTIYLSSQALNILEKQIEKKEENDWVWPNSRTNSGHVRKDTVTHELLKIDWEIDHWTVHDFRRALSSWLGEKGVLKEINDRMLNHVNRGIYETYNTHTYDSQARNWWQSWGDYLEQLSNK